MTDLTLSSKDPKSAKVDVLVLGVAASATPGGEPQLVGAGDLPRGLRSSLERSLSALGVTGKSGQLVRMPGQDVAASVVGLVGLGRAGARGAWEPEQLRRAAGAAVRELAGVRTVALALPAEDVASAAAVAEGALLGAYSFSAYRKASARVHQAPVNEVVILTAKTRDRALRAAVERARVLASAVHTVRDLVNTPPSDLPPAEFVAAATDAVKGLPIKLTVLDEKALAKGGYGGILGVGQGSTRPPRLVTATYAPSRPRAHLALVGKGITFDSGGVSIKPAAGMEAMKSDMAGAAAVLGAMLAVARLGLPITITGYLCLAENMPSGSAQRPSDVITIYGGRTVEVLNTDAEGRLVMADGLVAASLTKPDLIIDVATLTGAQGVALGRLTSAIMANDDDLRDRLHAASRTAGELFWPMPLPEELRAAMDSPVADIANMGEKWGGMLTAGVFLKEFVGTRDGSSDGEQIPWAHLDIASPAFNEVAAHDYTPKGGTGVAVRTLVTFVEGLTA